MEITPICDLCGKDCQMSHHAVVDCPQAITLRTAMAQHWQLSDDEQFRYTSKDWLLLLLERCPMDQRCLILLLWRTWYVHNSITHNTGHILVMTSLGFLLESLDEKGFCTSIRLTAKGSRYCRMEASQQGVLSLQFKSSVLLLGASARGLGQVKC